MLCDSEVKYPLFTGPSCTCGFDGYNVSMLVLFSGATLGSCIGVSMGY